MPVAQGVNPGSAPWVGAMDVCLGGAGRISKKEVGTQSSQGSHPGLKAYRPCRGWRQRRAGPWVPGGGAGPPRCCPKAAPPRADKLPPMSLETAEALILDVTDLHDRDRIVTFLTREHGKKSGVAQGARVKHSRFGGQLQPLAKVAGHLVREGGAGAGADLHGGAGAHGPSAAGGSRGDPARQLPRRPPARVRPGGRGRPTISSACSTRRLEALLAGVDRDLAARYFESWVLRLAGVFPAPRACPSCGSPFSAEGAMLPRCGRDAALPRVRRPERPPVDLRTTLAFLRRIGRESLPAVRRIARLPAAVLRQVEDLCAQVRRYFLQRELRSYDVIQQTLARSELPG